MKSLKVITLFTISFFAPRLDIVGGTPYEKQIIANVDVGYLKDQT